MGSVYFVAADGRIKIGFTAGPVEKRIKHFRTYLTGPIEIIGHMDGDVRVERAVHGHLKQYRLQGEWFRDCAEVRGSIRNFLMANAATTPRAAALARKVVAPKVRSDEEYGAMLGRLANLIWPNDAIRGFAVFAECDEELVRAWFVGTTTPSPLVQHAFAAKVVQYAMC